MTAPQQPNDATASWPWGTGPGATFFDSIRRLGLARSQQRWIGGVSGAIANRFGIDPAIVRGIFAVSILLGGLGLWAYGAAWALLPDERDGRIHFQELMAGRFDIAIVGSAAMIVAGFAVPSTWFGFHSPLWGILQAMVLVAGVVLIIWLIASSATKSKTGTTTAWSAGASWPQPNPPSSNLWAAAPTTPASHDTAGPSDSTATTPIKENTINDSATPEHDPDAVPAADAPTETIPKDEAPTAAMYATPTTPPPPYRPAPYRPASYRQSGPAPAPLTTQVPVGPGAPVAVNTRPHVPGPGSLSYAIVFAFTLFTAAGLLIARRLDYDVPVAALTIGAFVVLTGATILVAGLRGRRAGGLTAMAIIGLILCVPASASARVDWDAIEFRGRWTSVEYTPTSWEQLENDGFRAELGDATVDLTQLGEPREDIDASIRTDVGVLEITVPSDVAIIMDITTDVGGVDFFPSGGQGSSTSSDIVGGTYRFETAAAIDDIPDDATVHLTVKADVGSVTIIEQD